MKQYLPFLGFIYLLTQEVTHLLRGVQVIHICLDDEASSVAKSLLP